MSFPGRMKFRLDAQVQLRRADLTYILAPKTEILRAVKSNVNTLSRQFEFSSRRLGRTNNQAGGVSL